MGEATSADGTKYDVPSIIGSVGGVQAMFHSGDMEQKLTVAKSLRKGSIWLDALLWNKEAPYVFMERPEWKISEVEKLGQGHKRVHFQPLMKTRPDEEPVEPQSFANLVKEIGLTDEKLKKILESMLVNVFIPKTLKKLEKSEYLEFVMDEEWIYLRCGDIAYRV